MNREKKSPFRAGELFGFGLKAALLATLAGGCATVRPEQRATLADPTMRFDGEPGEQAALEHVLENREASYGGGSVKGGGCGCN